MTILRWKDGAWLPNCIHYFAGNKLLELTSTKIKITNLSDGPNSKPDYLSEVSIKLLQRAPTAQTWQRRPVELKPGRNSPSQLKTQTLLLATNGGHFNSLCFMVTGSLLEPASEDSYRYCSFRHYHLSLFFQPLRFHTFTSHWHLALHLGSVELCDEH